MNEKRFTCKSGENDGIVTEVALNGVAMAERLTPKLAARAARVAFGHRSGVSVVSNDEHGYRLYANSARKFTAANDKEIRGMTIERILYQYGEDDAGQFGGDADLSAVDIPASYDAFDVAIRETLEAVYPGTRVLVSRGCDFLRVDGMSDHEEAPGIEDVIHDVWEEFGWVVRF